VIAQCDCFAIGSRNGLLDETVKPTIEARSGKLKVQRCWCGDDDSIDIWHDIDRWIPCGAVLGSNSTSACLIGINDPNERDVGLLRGEARVDCSEVT
jgi:hypothetical protein